MAILNTKLADLYIYFTYYTKNKPPINCYLNVVNKLNIIYDNSQETYKVAFQNSKSSDHTKEI